VPATRLSRLPFLLSAFVLGACWDDPAAGPSEELQLAAQGRLQATYAAPTKSITPGLRSLQLSSTGRAFGVFIPATYDPTVPTPVIFLMHGRGGNGEALTLNFRDIAERAGVVVVAPNSRATTWDLLLDETGFDVAFIDGILRWTFDNINVDAARLTIGGFSDGGTYATWLGLRNGALFRRLAIFSGCAAVPSGRVGQPRLYITHGISDSVFPIDTCSRVLVPALQTRGYTVEYTEYEAGHIIPVDVADIVFDWIVNG
jgi:phospholipase/carboxylesterase